jgi:hypothetical protein
VWRAVANGIEAVQDGRIHIELINAPFLRWLHPGRIPRRYRTRDHQGLPMAA